MRAFALVLLAVAAANAEADADAFTLGQVAHGYARGVITGVDYGNGVVSGYGAIGNRGVNTIAAPVVHTPSVFPNVYSGNYGVNTPSVYSTGFNGHYGVNTFRAPVVHTPSVYSTTGYSGHYYSKREAEAEADPQIIDHHGVSAVHPNTYSTVHPINTVAGVSAVHPINTYSTVHPINTVAGVSAVHPNTYSTGFPINTVAGVSAVHHNAYSTGFPINTIASSFPTTYSSYPGYTTGYNIHSGHSYGKREAEAEADPQLISHLGVSAVHPNTYSTGFPINTVAGVSAVHHNAYSTGFPINTVAGVSAVHHNAYSTGFPINTVAGSFPTTYSSYPGYTTGYNIHSGHSYGKREAEAEADPQLISHVGVSAVHPNTYSTVHPINTIAGVSAVHPINTVAGVSAIHPINTIAGVSAVHPNTYSTVHPINTIAGVSAVHPINTVAGVSALHHNTYSTGFPINTVGFPTTYSSYPSYTTGHNVHSGHVLLG